MTATVPAVRTDDQPAGASRSMRKTFFNSMVAAYTGWNDSRNEGSRAVRLAIPSTQETDQPDAAGSRERLERGGFGCYDEDEDDPASLLDPQAMQDAVRIMDEISVAFRWHQGDVLLLDNRTVMHSRRCFEGPRRILASLARDPFR